MNKNGFTLIELLVSMTLMTLILIIIMPNILGLSDSTKQNIIDSKIKTIEANVLKDAKNDINNKSNCVGTITSSKSNCIYDAKNYLQKIDSKDTSLKGKVFICYDNSKLDIVANYSENDSYRCFSGPAVNSIFNIVGDVPETTTDVIERKSPTNATCTNTLAYDGTSDNNLRYVGANPCNYVDFNNELWRIVGVMTGIDDGTGKKESRIKIVRAKSLKGNFCWDTSETDINVGYGVNEWAKSDLMQELNGDYLNTNLSANTTWYSGKDNKHEGVYDYTEGLKAEAQSLIGNAKWLLGGNNTYISSAAKFYTAERSTNVWGSETGQTCKDEACPRSASWTGKVALLYPSDYGFAVGGAVRKKCLSKDLYNYGSDGCDDNIWISNFDTNGNMSTQWLLTPDNHSSNSAFVNNGNDIVSYFVGTEYNFSILPSVYLKSSVKIINGDGSKENPYKFN